MKLHVLSDLHLEFNPFTPSPVEADLVILAGDTDVKTKGIQWARHAFEGRDVLYLAGNHEYYHARFPGLLDKLREAARGSSIRVLENESFTQGGYRFFGGTLWSDMALFGDATTGSLAALEMNDYKHIRHSASHRRLRPVDTRMQHEKSVHALRSFLQQGDPRPSVIVTHHAPSAQSLHGYRREDPVSCAYASNLESLILEFQPLLWIHGHIHHTRRYKIGETTVLANPRGYHEEPRDGFDPELVIDLDKLASDSSRKANG